MHEDSTPARLHHERVARTGVTPARWLVMTHGIYGAGNNWRGIARKLTERRPEWGVVLVDLRQHGRSEPGQPPHTVTACARDLRAAIAELGNVEALAGHSFGGKVALQTRGLVALRQTWVLDASPSARPDALTDPDNSVVRVLELMERLPTTWPRRDDFVAAVLAEGFDGGLAQWLAMNLVPTPYAAGAAPAAGEASSGTFTLRLDLAALRELLADYYATDLWSSVDDPEPGELEFVIATRSSTLTSDDRRRLARAPSHIHVHDIDAGHWLHIEAPAAVVDRFASQLP